MTSIPNEAAKSTQSDEPYFLMLDGDLAIFINPGKRFHQWLFQKMRNSSEWVSFRKLETAPVSNFIPERLNKYGS